MREPGLRRLARLAFAFALMRRTFDWIWAHWSWHDTWGWDYPLVASWDGLRRMP